MCLYIYHEPHDSSHCFLIFQSQWGSHWICLVGTSQGGVVERDSVLATSGGASSCRTGRLKTLRNGGEVPGIHRGTVDGCEILHQLIGGLSHALRVSTIQGAAGCLPSTDQKRVRTRLNH